MEWLYVAIISLVVAYFAKKAMERPAGIPLETHEERLAELYVKTRDISHGGFIIAGSASEGKLILTNQKLRYTRYDEKRISLTLHPEQILNMEIGQPTRFKEPSIAISYTENSRARTVKWSVPSHVKFSELSKRYTNPHTAESFFALLQGWKQGRPVQAHQMVDEASHYCRYCGAEISGSDAFCMACGKQVATISTQSQMSASQYQAPAHIEVPNYLFQALLTTLCCFPPLGIVAIVYSFQVNRKMKTGDHAGALEVSRKAKLWVIVAAVIGAIAWAIIMISEEPFK